MQTLTTALRDEVFDRNQIDLEANDSEIDPDEHDSGFCSAAAYSNGPVWAKDSDSGRRKEFWDWWLTDAVLAAWAVG